MVRRFTSLWRRFPGVRSIQAFVPQFALAPERSIEIWLEIDDCAPLDGWDAVIPHMGHEFVTLMSRSAECVEYGSARLVGDWPGSGLEELHDEL